MNYIAFINNIAESLHNIGFDGISQFALLWMIPVAFIIVIFFIWIILRKVRLWYWKTDIKVDTLQSIDGRLKVMEDELQNLPDLFQDKPNLEPAQEKESQKEEIEENVKKTDVEGTDSILPEILEDVEEDKSLRADFFHTGKSGRIYTEEELWLQIRE